MAALPSAEALLAQGVRRLDEAFQAARPQRLGDSSATLDAQLLLAHATGVSRTRAMTDLERIPDAESSQRYRGMIERRAAGEPLAYILGVKEFWSLPLKVGPAVLVPRPETELLVERALALRDKASSRAADLGTGSGAIALALAAERPGWEVVATDVSADALATARANAAALNLSWVEFALGNWFEPLGGRTFDLVVSNPPYVAEDDQAMQDPTLRYEPHIALTPGNDSLACLREIIRTAPEHLVRDGWLLLEHGAEQAPAVAHELVGRGFRSVRSHRDLAGHERVTEAQFP